METKYRVYYYNPEGFFADFESAEEAEKHRDEYDGYIVVLVDGEQEGSHY